MANLTDYTYFYGEIKIPNLNSTDKISSLNVDISVYEKEILTDLIGYELYKDFVENQTDQRWVDFIEGKEFEFEFNGKTLIRKWNGLTNTIKLSLLSDYTYYKLKEQEATISAEIGEVIPNGENSLRANSTDKMVNAWLRMRELYGITPYGFNKLNEAHYIHYNDLPTAYNFLLANIETYENWEFEPKNSVNVFDY
ncbi:MAG: hypothetical protein JRC68_10025 [Deltaproteobacteria bacterium]|nr:hypothetical protein [Deltaproteobacteria bacterium]